MQLTTIISNWTSTGLIKKIWGYVVLATNRIIFLWYGDGWLREVEYEFDTIRIAIKFTTVNIVFALLS